MHITIENNKCVVNLDPIEFAVFETMFQNLQKKKTVKIEMREFSQGNFFWQQEILPLHLCRTIGEANLSEDPFATVSLYPFWKHGFAFGENEPLRLSLGLEDPHKKAVAADEFGMGFTAWAMEEIFHCVEWADTSALLKQGAVFPVGTKRPDFVCNFADGTLGVFEAKGTTSTNINPALAEGKIQTAGITAPVPISYRVVTGAIVGDSVKLIMLDPEPTRSLSGVETNLTPELVLEAARAMRVFLSKKRGGAESDGVCIPAPTETLFRSSAGEIILTTEMKPDKRHTWLDVK